MEPSAPFVWQDSYMVGHRELDRQHREFLDLITKLSGVHGRGNAEETRSCLQRVVRYATDHFTYEEHLLEASGYEDLEDHRHEHEQYKIKAEDFVRRYAADATDATDLTDDILAFLRDWFLEHILNVDQKFSDHLRQIKPSQQ